MDALIAFFGVALSLPGGAMFLLGGAVMWVLRKYLVKTKPDEVALIDAWGTKYGTQAKEKLKEWKASLDA